jgi:hypothetical protein
VRCLHCGKPIIDHRLSLDVSEMEGEADDDSTDAKKPARAPRLQRTKMMGPSRLQRTKMMGPSRLQRTKTAMLMRKEARQRR